jgi:hypothetical protein
MHARAHTHICIKKHEQLFAKHRKFEYMQSAKHSLALCEISCSHGMKYEDDTFWDIVEVDQRFRGVYCLHHGDHCPDDGGSMHL